MKKNELSFRSEKYIQFLKKMIKSLLFKIFRIEITGQENVSDLSGSALFVANHNVGAVIESHSLLFEINQTSRPIYGLNHKSLFKIPFVSEHFRKIGAVTADKETAELVLREKCGLLIFPGGNRQAFRPWSQRHDNSFRWARGWAELAIQTQTPVVPVKFSGSHNVNPIFFTSKWFSKFLVLPHLLGVSWFPLSLAQIILSIVSFVLTFQVWENGYVSLFIGYLLLCLTPLIPVIPSQIKVKIYPPLNPHNKTVDDLIEEMACVMNKNDMPHGKRVKYSLNGIERFMLAQESETLHFNSQFVFDFKGTVDQDYILQTTDKWIQAVPQIRSAVHRGFRKPQRYIYDQAWFRAADIVQFHYGICQNKTDEISYRKFNLSFEPAVRFDFLSDVDGNQHRLVFSCHHSLFDGAAQAFAFEEWSRIYNEQRASGRYVKVNTFRYREMRAYLGTHKFFRLLWNNLTLSLPRNPIEVASLVSNSASKNRMVKARTLFLPNDVSARENFYELCIRAVDRTLQKENDMVRPIVAYIPVGLRWPLKIKASLQNIVVSNTLFLKRENCTGDLLTQKINERLKKDPIESNSRFLFGALPVSSFASEEKLKKMFSKFEYNIRRPTCTLGMVHAPIPKGLVTPKNWFDLYISARGTLARSPSLGFIFTGKLGYETITIQYLPDFISHEQIESITAEIKKNLRIDTPKNKPQISELSN